MTGKVTGERGRLGDLFCFFAFCGGIIFKWHRNAIHAFDNYVTKCLNGVNDKWFETTKNGKTELFIPAVKMATANKRRPILKLSSACL